jgi:GDPmannose 4,6-dehydratase
VVNDLLTLPLAERLELGYSPTTTLEQLVAKMVATDKEEGVGSMENPPANPRAIEQARGGQA